MMKKYRKERELENSDLHPNEYSNELISMQRRTIGHEKLGNEVNIPVPPPSILSWQVLLHIEVLVQLVGGGGCGC